MVDRPYRSWKDLQSIDRKSVNDLSLKKALELDRGVSPGLSSVLMLSKPNNKQTLKKPFYFEI